MSKITVELEMSRKDLDRLLSLWGQVDDWTSEEFEEMLDLRDELVSSVVV